MEILVACVFAGALLGLVSICYVSVFQQESDLLNLSLLFALRLCLKHKQYLNDNHRKIDKFKTAI